MNEDYYHEQNSCYDHNSFGFDQVQPPQYTVNHPIFNSQNELLNSQNKLMEQMTTLRDLVGQVIQKKEEEKSVSDDDNSSSDDVSPYGRISSVSDCITPPVLRSSVRRSGGDFPPAGRSNFNHEEFADELTHIMSLPNLECFKFKIEPNPGDLDSIDLGIRKNASTTNVNVPLKD
ncbi:hypothetical protein Tco_1078504 [Tanacetum coccineum]|uniref:Uncharacterized protein n=1 Tax=Tanacetum coccineum TaxID=301880 RepID=A0ABQ5HQ28_9ASTR